MKGRFMGGLTKGDRVRCDLTSGARRRTVLVVIMIAWVSKVPLTGIYVLW